MKKGLVQFIIGIVIALAGGFFMFEGSFLGENNTTIAIVIGIVGILLIATSKYRLMGRKK